MKCGKLDAIINIPQQNHFGWLGWVSKPPYLGIAPDVLPRELLMQCQKAGEVAGFTDDQWKQWNQSQRCCNGFWQLWSLFQLEIRFQLWRVLDALEIVHWSPPFVSESDEAFSPIFYHLQIPRTWEFGEAHETHETDLVGEKPHGVLLRDGPSLGRPKRFMGWRSHPWMWIYKKTPLKSKRAEIFLLELKVFSLTKLNFFKPFSQGML